MFTFLDFEKPIAELQGRIDEICATAGRMAVFDIAADVARLQAKSDKLLRDTFARLTPWQKTQVARHPNARTSNIMSPGCSRNDPAGRRPRLGDDQAIIGGFATFRGARSW